MDEEVIRRWQFRQTTIGDLVLNFVSERTSEQNVAGWKGDEAQSRSVREPAPSPLPETDAKPLNWALVLKYQQQVTALAVRLARKSLQTGTLDQETVGDVALDHCMGVIQKHGDNPTRLNYEFGAWLTGRLVVSLKKACNRNRRHAHQPLPDEHLLGYEPETETVEELVDAIPSLKPNEKELLLKVLTRPDKPCQCEHDDKPTWRLIDALHEEADRMKWKRLKAKLQQKALEGRL